MTQPEGRPASAVYSSSPESLSAILEGRLDDIPKTPSRTLKIYLCSNYNDFRFERSFLQRDVFPDIQKHCLKYGLDIVWHDVHFGSGVDHAKDAHAFNLHLDAIDECYQESAGTFFVCLIGQEYGDCPLPLILDECEFIHIRHEAFEGGKDIRLLDEWYVKDENNIPHTYNLKPISEKFSNFYPKPKDENSDHQLDVEAWCYTYDSLLDIIQYGAHIAHNEGYINQVHLVKQQRFFSSVLEQQVRHALRLTNDRCIFIYRNIEADNNGNTNKPNGKALSRDNDANEIYLKQLKQMVDSRVLHSNIFAFNLKCLDERYITRDLHYLESITAALATQIRKQITIFQMKSIHFPSSEFGNTLLESLVHLHQCKKLFKEFNGYLLNSVLSSVQMLLLNESKSDHYAIVIKGPAGSGKTMFATKVFHRAKELFGKETVLFIRFVGLTSQSRNAKEVLRQICMHFNYMLTEKMLNKYYEYGDLVNYFNGLMKRISNGKRHFIVLLDDVDKFVSQSTNDSKCFLDWIGIKFSSKFHMILMTTNQEQLEVLSQKTQRKTSTTKGIINLPEWSKDRYKVICDDRLAKDKRTVSKSQETIAMRAFQGQINMHNLLDHIILMMKSWSSSHKVNSSCIPSSILEFEHQLLDDLEAKLGRNLVKSVCLYITISHFGISEMEILDILTCKHKLSNETPTWTRFPSSLWLKVKQGLGYLLTTKFAQDKYLLCWSNESIGEVVRQRYGNNESLKEHCRDIANLFSETWVYGELYSIKDGIQLHYSDINRLICPQPLLYSETRFNLRRINELWMQMLNAGDIVECKRSTLCNFEYLLALMHSSSVRHLMSVFNRMMDNLLDADIFLIYKSIEASQSILTLHPAQLANELIGRLKPIEELFSDFVENLVSQCMQWCDNSMLPIFVPVTTWLPCPHVSLIAHLDSFDGGSITVPLPNNQHIISSYGLLDIATYSVASRKMLKIYSGHRGPVRTLCVSDDGKIFASGSDDGTIRIWQTDAGLCTNVIREHTKPVISLLLSRSLGFLFSGSEDTTIVVCNFTSGKRLHVLRRHTKSVTSLQLNSAKTLLISASRDMRIILWYLDDMSELMCIYDGLHTPILCMDVSKDNTFILAGCEDNTLNVISFTTGSWIHHLKGHNGWINHLMIADDCYHAVAGCQDSKVYLYNIRTTELLEVYQGHSTPVMHVTISKDQSLVFSSSDGKVNVWSLYKRKTKTVYTDDHTAHVSCMVLASEGKVALTCAVNGEMKVWNLVLNTFLENFPGHSDHITCIAASSDGAFCITASKDKTVKVWSMSLATVITNYEEHQAVVEDLKILEDQIRICSHDDIGQFRIWKADDGVTLAAYNLSSTNFILSHDSQFLVVTKGDNYARVWRTDSGVLVTSISHSDKITCFTCDSNDQYLLTGSADKSCKIWELRTGKLTQVLVEHDSHVVQIVITDDCQTVISGSAGGTIIVWDLMMGEVKHKLIGHADTVTNLTLMTNNNFIISGSHDGTIRLWNIASGHQVTIIDMHVPVLTLLVTEDGSRMVVQLEKSTKVPIVCPHNYPAQGDGIEDSTSNADTEDELLLPLQPKQPFLHRASFEYPIPKKTIKCRKDSESNHPEIVRFSPITAPKRQGRTLRRPPININLIRNKQQTSDSQSKLSSVCIIL